jgi:4-hydroxy-3-polyprenylbenzoate decarboxylase
MSACVEGLPYGMSELAWAGGVKGQPIPVVIGRHTGLPIPANAEVAFEGFMRPNVEHDEGPYGEWHGYYTRGTRTTPQIDLVAMYHRDDPILLGCPQGKPPHEDNRFLAPLRSTLIHKQIEAAGASGVTGVWCPPLAGNRLLTIVKLQQRYPGHARQVAHLAAQCGAGAYNGRYIVVVDDDIDITNMDDVWWAILTRSDPAEDVEFIRRAWSTQIDPVVPYGQVPHTSRAIIDACIPWERRQDYPESIVEPAYARETRQLWGHILNGR